MRRRALLAALPAAGSLALAGCLDRIRPAAAGESDDDARPEVRSLSGWRPPFTSPFHHSAVNPVADGESVELVAVGSGEDTHWMTVAAESDDPVETTVEIRSGDGETLHETTVGLSNTRYLGVRFAHVQHYVVEVESDRHEGNVDVSEGWIDCNESNQAVLLTEDGRVEVHGASTDLAC